LSVLESKLGVSLLRRTTRRVTLETPKGKTLHLIADNYATHKHPAVQDWLAEQPRFNMHFTPTSAS
jgi:hypothetical protein